MTFSILVFDQKTGTFGAAAATGSLCVGGWVIRGSLDAGLVASQGTAPSTLWRDDALIFMRRGMSAENALQSAVYGDAGCAHRQIITLDATGRTAGFTGDESVDWAGHVLEHGIACAGNMIAGAQVIEHMREAFRLTPGAMPDRLMAALRAARQQGGDSRGLLSAAMIVLSPDAAPIDLRVDYSTEPLTQLSELLDRVRQPPYADWLHEVPVQRDPMRGPATPARSVSIASKP